MLNIWSLAVLPPALMVRERMRFSGLDELSFSATISPAMHFTRWDRMALARRTLKWTNHVAHLYMFGWTDRQIRYQSLTENSFITAAPANITTHTIIEKNSHCVQYLQYVHGKVHKNNDQILCLVTAVRKTFLQHSVLHFWRDQPVTGGALTENLKGLF